MTSLYKLGMAYTKLAFGPEAQDKVLQAFKAKQLPQPKRSGGGYGYFNPRSVRPRVEVAQGSLKEMIDHQKESPDFAYIYDKHVNKLRKRVRDLKRLGGSVIAPSRGDALKSMSANFPKAKTLPQVVKDVEAANPGNMGSIRKGLDAVVKGHELAESQIPKSRQWSTAMRQEIPKFESHMSPEVLLREHNMISTLPESQKGVGDIIRAMRQDSREAKVLSTLLPGFEFGKSPRLSPAMKKNYTRRLSDYATWLAEKVRKGR